ncbi:hypothetical protein LEP1GSC198_1336 [Leptospira kirschneri str. JB]|nr:hypothetical protein LEP1GSC198_1336 [Leptospira kirschneri str. JB]
MLNGQRALSAVFKRTNLLQAKTNYVAAKINGSKFAEKYSLLITAQSVSARLGDRKDF